MLDEDRWVRLLLSLLDELAIDEYMHIRRELWRAHMRRGGRHVLAACATCLDLRDTWEKP